MKNMSVFANQAEIAHICVHVMSKINEQYHNFKAKKFLCHFVLYSEITYSSSAFFSR